MNKPTIIERFTDNGEHSHYSLIETETGDLLWSEAPEEETQQVKKLSLSAVSVNEVAVCNRTSCKYYNVLFNRCKFIDHCEFPLQTER